MILDNTIHTKNTKLPKTLKTNIRILQEYSNIILKIIPEDTKNIARTKNATLQKMVRYTRHILQKY